MSLFLEMGIIVLISFVGVVLNKTVGIPIPGTVLAMIIFYILLETKVIKVNRIGKACDFLNNNMALFFIPLNVGLLVSYKVFAHKAVAVVLTVIISTAVGIVFSYAGVVLVSKFIKGGGNGIV
ncbi:MAG: CidA/LrgA family protein [Filifactoraceae bacterium]